RGLEARHRHLRQGVPAAPAQRRYAPLAFPHHRIRTSSNVASGKPAVSISEFFLTLLPLPAFLHFREWAADASPFFAENNGEGECRLRTRIDGQGGDCA